MRRKAHLLYFLILASAISSSLFLQTYMDPRTPSGFMQEDIKFYPKRAGYWNLASIHIDDTDPAKNWSYTAATYDWCSGNGTWSNPYILENITIVSVTSIGILIENSNVFFRVQNNTVQDVSNNHPYGNIKLINTDNGIITNNTVTGSYYGIYLQTSSNNNTVSNNIASGNSDTGIHMRDNNHDNFFINNTVRNNGWGGIYFYNNCDRNLVSGNFLENNDGRDLYLSTDNDENNFTENKIIDSGDGVRLVQSDNNGNRIFLNNFSLMQGLDDGSGNFWDNRNIGNVWSVYSGNDADDDGIGDSAYNVPGTANAKDNFPIYDDGDDIAPQISIVNPSNNTIFGHTPPAFQVSIVEYYLNSSWYTIDGSSNQFFEGESGNINLSLWNSILNGTYTLAFYTNDSLGRIDSESVIINKDIIPPNIIINSPKVSRIYSSDSPQFDLQINETNLHTSWYFLENETLSSSNYTFSGNGFINQTAWNLYGNGTVTIVFFANDTIGNLNSVNITIKKDIKIPELVVIDPIPGNLYGNTSPSYNISIFEGNLNSTWYSLNGFNETIWTIDGVLDQALWDLQGNGTVSIIFYANDSVGNFASLETIVRKDILAPIITINTPTTNQLFGIGPPSFDLTIIEGNLDTIWYTLDGGGNNYIISELTGIINQEIWDIVPNGFVTIKFYVNDTLGYMSFKEVTLVKDVPTPTNPPGIPGYNFVILIGIFSIVAYIAIKFRYNIKIK